VGKVRWCVIALLCIAVAGFAEEEAAERELVEIRKEGPPEVWLAQLVPGEQGFRAYANAFPTLLAEINRVSTIKTAPDPMILRSFEDPEMFKYPFIYANFADRKDWTFSPLEIQNLKRYLERGGFLYIDAGINAEFLRGQGNPGQHHSFADWSASPALKDAFHALYPEKEFRPLEREHELYDVMYPDLPDASLLPDTVREFVINEKWPEATYSAVGLKVHGRVAVLATPIIAMGWGRNSMGNWSTNIRFRVREGTTGLADYLETAAYSGARYESTREDSLKDVIYCQKQALPSWVNEPDGTWRVFRYYGSREISDYAHVFYTQLGVNIVMYALLN